MLRGTGQAGDNPMLIPLPADHHRHDHSRYRLDDRFQGLVVIGQ
jgi:hypothetical protein